MLLADAICRCTAGACVYETLVLLAAKSTGQQRPLSFRTMTIYLVCRPITGDPWEDKFSLSLKGRRMVHLSTQRYLQINGRRTFLNRLALGRR